MECICIQINLQGGSMHVCIELRTYVRTYISNKHFYMRGTMRKLHTYIESLSRVCVDHISS